MYPFRSIYIMYMQSSHIDTVTVKHMYDPVLT